MQPGTGRLTAGTTALVAVLALTIGATAAATSAAGAAAVPTPIWQVQSTPSPGANAGLHAISCASVDRCVAVGDTGKSPLAESWNGAVWTVDPIIDAPTGDVTMQGVSCATATFCVAVGEARTAFSLLYDGTRWRLRSTVADRYGLLTAVSCSRTTFCMAVGSTDSSGGPALTERWDGSSWRRIDVPGSAAQQSQFKAVSCIPDEVCTAVGTNKHDPSGGFGLAERYADGSWTEEVQPHVPGGTEVFLDAVSCPSAAGCVAVGDAAGEDSTSALSEVRSHGHWRVEAVQPHELDSGLSGVACSSLLDCRAVGDAIPLRTSGLVETWNGAAWHRQRSAAIGGPPQLEGVSCSTGMHCSAAGTDPDASNGETTVVERN